MTKRLQREAAPSSQTHIQLPAGWSGRDTCLLPPTFPLLCPCCVIFPLLPCLGSGFCSSSLLCCIRSVENRHMRLESFKEGTGRGGGGGGDDKSRR